MFFLAAAVFAEIVMTYVSENYATDIFLDSNLNIATEKLI